MEVISKEPRTEAKGAAATLSEEPETPTEEKAVACFIALEKAEHEFTEGVEFGKAVIELRDEIRASHGRNFKNRLEELGITYAKARYWMAIADGKKINRGKAREKAQLQEPAWNWDIALANLKPLVDKIDMLRRRDPVGSSLLHGETSKLAEILGYELVKKGGGNA